MIYASLKDLKSYLGLSKNMDTAINYLLNNNLSGLSMGKNEIDGDNVFINRFDYETLPEQDCFFEEHEIYADIHVVISGNEKIALADADTLTQTKKDVNDDFTAYTGKPETVCVMNKSKFLIAFTLEPHMVKIQHTGCEKVEKAVFKVKIN